MSKTSSKSKEKLITPTDSSWRARQCFYCEEQFVPEDFQPKNHRLIKFKIFCSSEIMLSHKKCLVEFKYTIKKAWQQIKKSLKYGKNDK